MINKYKYIVTYNAVDTEVFPMFDSDAEIKYENKGDEIALLKKFSGKLVFSNKNGSADYDYFLDIETNGQCVLLQLDVQQLCTGVYTSIITAEFGIVDGEWDKDNCTFTVEPNPNGLYACLLSETKVNILTCDVATVNLGTTQANVTDGAIPEFALFYFGDVLLYVAQQICPDVNSIISDFFQINPVNVSTVNSITGMNNVYTRMGMTALSNVRNPLPSNPATTELTTWKDLMDDLRTMFNVYWTVDTNGDIRIEHFNFFNSGAGLDLTQSQYDKYMSGTNKYKYNRKDSPRYETWTMHDSEQSGEITYDNACGNNKLDEDRVTYTVKKIYTDFTTAWFEPDKLSGSTQGIFLFATDGDFPVSNMLGTNENSELVLPRLVLKFHRWGRPQLNGTFKPIPKLYDYTLNNSEDLFIYSEKPVKEQTEITIPLCCDETFDSAKYQTTFMGVKGIVMNAVHKLRDNILRLSLKYKVNADNVDVLPSAISDLAVWLIGDTGKTVSGGLVTNWADQSGNGNDFEQPTVADQPTDASDHLIFDGDMMFSSAAFQTFPAKRGSVFIVSKSSLSTFPALPAGSLADVTFLSIDSANKWDISLKYAFDAGLGTDIYEYYSFSESALYPAQGFLSIINYAYYAWTDKIFLFELIRDGNTSQTVWLNGKGTHTSPMTIANTQPDVDNLILGGIDATNNRYYGKIYEIIIYDRALTPIERQKVEQYLAKKYELNLYSVS